MADTISCREFTQFLVDQLPYYDDLILSDIRPTDSWVANVKQGTWDAHTSTEHTIDRFNHVYADTTQVWATVQDGTCVGTPCDPATNKIGWGATRKTYFLEQQSWETDLLCYDQLLSITKSEEHFQQIITDVLRPATSDIYSAFLRKRGLDHAGKLITANSTMDPFTFVWSQVGTSERFFDCSVSPTNVFLLTPPMLQRQFNRLMNIGYDGKNPFKDTAGNIELVTDIETCWSLEKLAGQESVSGVPSVSANWRFQQWGESNAYWKYGFSGQIGNFLIRTDFRNLRFQFVQDLGGGAAPHRYRYQVIQAYTNVPTNGGVGFAPGLKSEYNTSYDEACFTVSYIWHKMGIEALVADATPFNPQMPFNPRNFGGRWQFVMNNLTCGFDTNGNPIAVDNSRMNKGKFIADFRVGIRPLYTEFINVFFHKRQPMCVLNIDTCETCPADPYVTQDYNSENDPCPTIT